MTRKGRRMALIVSALAVGGVALGLVLFAMRDSVVFFYGPTEAAQKAHPGQRLRIGGLIAPGSVQKSAGKSVSFAITDGSNTVSVSYTGLLPDLFREGQGVVAEGVLTSPGMFAADSVLAKHDERYMPREVAEALKKEGRWQGELQAQGTKSP